jgi:Cysteine-rich CWC
MSAGTTGPQAVGSAPAHKACAACGEKFSCSASAATCWCESVKLDQNALSKLRARYTDCLCPLCLSAVQTNSGSEKSA